MRSHPSATNLLLLALSLVIIEPKARGQAPIEPANQVDTGLALKIGTIDISRYAVQKNLNRFARSLEPQSKGAPSPEATRGWFELYLARQVIIAEAVAQGYAERPEVAGIVETMERHMLAQADGPLYSVLAPAESPSEEQLREAFARTPRGQNQAPITFEGARPGLERAFRQQQRQAILRERRIAVLQTNKFAVRNEAVEHLLPRLRSAVFQKAEIPEEVIAPIAAEILATYTLDGKTIEISTAAWRGHFNRLFIRRVPVSPEQFEVCLQDMVMTECDDREARRRGLDRTPQFLEDRRNFLYYQALDLFEKERLLPQIVVTADEVQAHYQSHLAEYVRPVRAHGRLLRFANERAAAEWLRTRQSAATQEGEQIVVSRAQPLPGFEQVTESILRMPAGRPFGPLTGPDDVAVFLKQTTDKETQPLEEVSSRIRNEIARQGLDALELKLAREWCSRFQIEDRLEPEQFGVAGPVARPWANSATK